MTSTRCPAPPFPSDGTGAYDSEQTSALTLSEFERWLTIAIVEIYHQRVHSELGTAHPAL